jgi:hypothetical protein
MRHSLRPVPAALAAGLLAATLACGDDGLTPPATAGTGSLVVQLTDAPFPFDSVKSVEVFVVRIDGKAAASDSADAAAAVADAEKDTRGWTTLAEPKARIDLLTLRDGKVTTLGQKALPAGSYKSFRLVIDPAQSVVTLKGGQTVDVHWPSAARSGIKVQLDRDVTVGRDSTKTLVVDFDVSESFVMRGNAMGNGFNFKPVLRGTSK